MKPYPWSCGPLLKTFSFSRFWKTKVGLREKEMHHGKRGLSDGHQGAGARATFSTKVRVMEKKPNKFPSQLFHATGACGQDSDPQDSNSHYSSGRWRKLS